MKTTMKNKTQIIALTALLVLSGQALAQEMALPVISKPAVLEEGTQRELTISQINELLPWAKDSKIFLIDLLDNTQNLSMQDKVERMIEGLKSIVGESAPKHSELLMRYSLNRGLVIAEILEKESQAEAVGTIDAKYRILRQSIAMAIKYYEIDMAVLAKKSSAPYVLFGLDYYSFLVELNKSVFDASAQYMIQRTALEWLQWDMYRDLNNTSYAAQIVKINNGLKIFPNRKVTDAQAISYLKQMKSLAQQLRVSETLEKLEMDKRLAIARNEEERQRILKEKELEEKALQERREKEERRRLGLPEIDVTIRSSDIVINGNTVRRVEYVSADGRVVLKEDSNNYQSTAALSQIEKAVPYYKDIKEGSTVITGNTVRVVERVGHKGAIVLLETSQHYRSFSNYSSVSIAVNELNGLKVGDKVLHGNNVRVIEYLSKDGRVVLKEDNNNYRTFTGYAVVSKVQ